jgi:hypothetical protein
MKAWVTIGAVILAAVTFTSAASPVGDENRVSSFARLPDWSGRWQVVGVTPNAAGGIAESYEQIRERFGARPPYKPEWLVRFQTLLKQLPDGPPGGARALCTWGVPMLMLESPLIFEALITPEETALTFSGRETRHIYTDGRNHLPSDRVFPTPWGDSIGRWEGETLVIDTVAVDSPRIFIWDSAVGMLTAVLSDRVHFVERLRMIGKDLLEDEMVVDDPVSLRSPWKLTHQYQRVTSVDRIIDEDCEGHERNPTVNELFTLRLQ